MPGSEPPSAPPGPDHFVGRSRELTSLESDLNALPHAAGPVRLLRGVAGVGKTRLAEELTRAARADGVTVVWGHNPDETTAPPFWPWTQVVRTLSGYGRGTDLAGLVLDPGETVDRFELFDAVAAAIRGATAVGPLLVVLDDLHSADHATLQLTRFLARHLSGAPILIVATVRTSAWADPTLAEHLDALSRLGRTIDLSGLPVDAVGDLLGDMRHAESVHAVTGGNPLHVHQLVRVLDQNQDDALPEVASGLDEALRSTVRRRVEEVTGVERAVLDRAAVLGLDFDRDELTALAEPIEPPAVVAALAHLDREGFVTDTSPGRFCHPVVAEVVRAAMSPTELHRLHHRAAMVIGDGADRVGEVANHLMRAGPDHRHDAVAVSRRAGSVATAAAAHEDAVVHLTHAIDVIDAEADGPLRLDVLLDLGAALWRAGRTADSDRAYEQAWLQSEVLGDAGSLARAVVRNGVEYYFADNARPDLAARVEKALAAQPDEPSPIRARLLAELATHHLAQTLPTGKRLAEQAVSMARGFDDPVALGNALIALQVTDLGPSTLTRRIADSHEILACARDADDHRLAAHGRFLLMVALLEAGDIHALDGELLQHDGVTDELGEPRYDRFSLWLRATRKMLGGDIRAAEALAEQTFEMSGRLGDPDAFGVYGGQVGVLLWMQGRVIETEPVYTDMRAAEPHEPLWPSVLAWLAATHGRPEEARGALAALPDPASLPGSMHWLLTATTYAEVAAMVGSDEQVDMAWNALVPYADHMVPVAMGAAVWGTVAKPLGHLALRRGHVDEGIAYLRKAMRTCARLGARPWMIDAQLDLADALATHRPAEAGTAAELRAEALETATHLGLDLFLRRIAASEPVVGPGAVRAAAGLRVVPAVEAPGERRPQVRVIGGFEVTDRTGTPARWTSRRARELLKILVSRRGAPISRESLMDLLWPDDDPAGLANRLSVALSTVRRALDPDRTMPSGDLISTAYDSVALNLSVVDVDVEHLLDGARSVLGRDRAAPDPHDHDVAAEAAELLDRHRGEALPDEPHADWAVAIRGEVRVAMTSLAGLVAEAAEVAGDHLRAVDAYRRILDIDPYDEAANLGLTAGFQAMGAHGQARSAYSDYQRRMADLGVPATARPAS